MPRKRVALFVPTLSGGGVERVTLNLASGFQSRGAETDVIAADARGELHDQVPEGVRLVDLHSRRVLTALPSLVRYLRHTQPDALIAMMEHCSVVALLARRVARVRTKVIATSHTNISATLRSSRRLRVHALPTLMRWWYPAAEAAVAVSAGAAEDLKAQVPNAWVVTIENPVLGANWRAQLSEPLEHEWFKSQDVPVVLGVGRLAPPKDFVTLIHSFANIRRRRRVRLVILGDGPDREALHRLTRELGIGTDVILQGFVPNVYPYMARAAVFVLSSRWEGFGLVLVEALASGAKVVATDCQSGPREILDHGRLGQLVGPGNIGEMTQAIMRALDSPAAPVPAEALAAYTIPIATARYAALLGPDW